MLVTTKFQCPECGGPLRQPDDDLLTCSACGASVPSRDGIADFVRGRFDTMLDLDAYDKEHGIDDRRPGRFYEKIRNSQAPHREQERRSWRYGGASVIRIKRG